MFKQDAVDTSMSVMILPSCRLKCALDRHYWLAICMFTWMVSVSVCILVLGWLQGACTWTGSFYNCCCSCSSSSSRGLMLACSHWLHSPVMTEAQQWHLGSWNSDHMPPLSSPSSSSSSSDIICSLLVPQWQEGIDLQLGVYVYARRGPVGMCVGQLC